MTKQLSDKLELLYESIQKYIPSDVMHQLDAVEKKVISADAIIDKYKLILSKAKNALASITTNLDKIRNDNKTKVNSIKTKYENPTTPNN